MAETSSSKSDDTRSSATGSSTTSSSQTSTGSGNSSSSPSGNSSKSSDSKSSSSNSGSGSSKSGGKGKSVYDSVGSDPKSPNSKADARGPVTRIKDGNGDETKVYPGMTVGYSSGNENPYDEGSYASDSVNAFYESRARNGVDLPS